MSYTNSLKMFSDTFRSIFGEVPNLVQFSSLDEIAAAMKRLQDETGAVYAIRSTEPSTLNATRRVYVCIRKGHGTLRPSQGLRQTPTRQTGCTSFINFSKGKATSFCASKAVLEHNHPLSTVDMRLHPRVRRLDEGELAIVRPMLVSGTPSFNVCDFARRHFNKLMTTKDVCNLRAKIMGHMNNPEYLRVLHQKLSETGCCYYRLDTDNKLTHFVSMTNEQRSLCIRYPEVIGIDATYRSCRERYSLFVLVAIDAFMVGIPVCFGFLASESAEDIAHFLSHFQIFAGPIPIRTMVMDDSAAIQAAVRNVFPNVNQLLCRVHLLRNVFQRVSSFILVDY